MALEDLSTMSTVMAASLGQTKERIEQLEVLFLQFVPAVESGLRNSESAISDLRNAHRRAEHCWAETKKGLERDLEECRAQSSRKSARIAELEEQLLLKTKRLQQQEDEINLKNGGQEELKQVKARLCEAEARLQEKSIILRSLGSRLKSLKTQYNSLLRQNALVTGYRAMIGAEDNSKERSTTTRSQEEVGKAAKSDKSEEDVQKNAEERSRQEEETDAAKHCKRLRATSESTIVPAKLAKPPSSSSLSAGKLLKTEAKRKVSLKNHFQGWDNWRTTRVETSGADPHDDFLNTPQEQALRSIAAAKPLADEERAASATVKSDDERAAAKLPAVEQPGAVEPRKDAAELTTAAASAGRKGWTSVKQQQPMYKYVEPVRKKSDREALIGIECRQCKKFYDAVFARDAEAVMNTKCERHHDTSVASRHRVRYAPPSTPEGFWNIDDFDD